MTTLRWLNQLERRFGKFSIPNLMSIIVFGMAIVFAVDLFIDPSYEFNLSSILYFDRNAILAGQVWRLLTFVFIPPSNSPIFILFALYFYWMIGTGLERQWGSFRFNIFYLLGILFNIISGCITGYATNDYLNMTLFFAFAMLFPNFQVLLFYFIPVKIKWLAIIDAVLLGVSLIFNTWSGRLAILCSILNFLVFFGPEMFYRFKMFLRRHTTAKRQKQNLQQNQNWKNHWWNDKDNNPFH